MQQTKYIQAHDLWSYTVQVTEAVREGYRPSDINEHYPVQLGIGVYCATFVREEEELDAHDAIVYPEPVTDVPAPTIKQRKTKGAAVVP